MDCVDPAVDGTGERQFNRTVEII